MFMKINIAKWIAKELHGTELELLRAEDALASAQLRVAALADRVVRLKAKAEAKAAPQPVAATITPALAAYDRARVQFNRALRTVPE